MCEKNNKTSIFLLLFYFIKFDVITEQGQVKYQQKLECKISQYALQSHIGSQTG